METDADLATLIRQKDHLNVLRYVRVHQIRDPELVVEHGKALLGPQLDRRKLLDEPSRLAALEQLCLAALDAQEPELAMTAIQELKKNVAGNSSRLRLLMARCLEASEDFSGAEQLYEELLTENPANLAALKRKYCVLRAQKDKQVQAMESLNSYLKQNYRDTASWYEMAQFRLELADYKGAAYALEEVLMGCPADSKVHTELAECYATVGGLESLRLARQHFSQALELDSANRRALFGLVVAANAFLLEDKKMDEHDTTVAQELVKFGAEKILEAYKGTPLFARVKKLMEEYTSDL